MADQGMEEGDFTVVQRRRKKRKRRKKKQAITPTPVKEQKEKDPRGADWQPTHRDLLNGVVDVVKQKLILEQDPQ
ncbi:unnamed protein product [Nezara viridula]|uniref:Uncharacterized protein n=1 Tax=Nezara viridula TaxID=85310 RepID=A0A9P0HF33_NEZVI|nr:unnamed protein product [Nezara viridula]